MKKLKIGITCYPSIGGSGIVATELGKALAAKGHEVHFITYDKPFRLDLNSKNIYFHKVQVNDYPLFKYPDYTLPLAVKMTEVADKYDLDLFHVHYAVPHATAALLARAMSDECRMCAPKVITTLHGTDVTLLANDKNLQPAIKFSIERSDGLTAVSESLAKETKKTLKTHIPIKVIYNFYEPVKKLISPKKIRESLGVKPNDFLLVHASNLRGVKRIEDLIKIMSLLKARKNIKLLLLSGGDFSPYSKLAKKLKVNNSLIVYKNIKDVGNYMNAGDAGIYTSETESFGMGILETMSYRKPILATLAGGVPEVVKNKESGFLYKVGDIKGFAKGIIKLSENEELKTTMGNNAKNRAEQFFSTQNIVKKYEEYYFKIINQKHNH